MTRVGNAEVMSGTPNSQRIQRIHIFAENWRVAVYEGDEWRDKLIEELREAKQAGDSDQQLAEAAGLSLSAIHKMLQ